MRPYIRTFSGKQVYLLDPKPSSLAIEDVAHALSQIVRFTGHCAGPYTVAQHCCLGSDIAPEEFKLATLLHDAQESILSDVNTPLKSCLTRYQEIETNFERIIARKWKIPYPMHPVVKEIDYRLLVTEMYQLMPGNDYKKFPFPPYDIKIRIWSHKKAKEEFLKRFKQLHK